MGSDGKKRQKLCFCLVSAGDPFLIDDWRKRILFRRSSEITNSQAGSASSTASGNPDGFGHIRPPGHDCDGPKVVPYEPWRDSVRARARRTHRVRWKGAPRGQPRSGLSRAVRGHHRDCGPDHAGAA